MVFQNEVGRRFDELKGNTIATHIMCKFTSVTDLYSRFKIFYEIKY